MDELVKMLMATYGLPASAATSYAAQIMQQMTPPAPDIPKVVQPTPEQLKKDAAFNSLQKLSQQMSAPTNPLGGVRDLAQGAPVGKRGYNGSF